MRKLYYKSKLNNFGDSINPFIFYKLLPHLFDSEARNLFFGIGTIIDDSAPKDVNKFVFGSGTGYKNIPIINNDWEFDFVRGPLTADRLGLSRDIAITDPAILIRKVVDDNEVQRIPGRISFMPHHVSARNADWANLCLQAGIRYIDPSENIHDIILKIRQSEFLLADAMHAAIVADAFRVPWIAVKCYDHILDFKWMDWCSSMEIEYSPFNITRIWDIERNMSNISITKNKIKSKLHDMGIYNKGWSSPFQKSNKSRVESIVVDELQKLRDGSHIFLSSDSVFNERLDRVYSRIERLRTIKDGVQKA